MIARLLLALCLILPVTAHDAAAATRKKPRATVTKITITNNGISERRVAKRPWRGYGFLPGYPPTARELRYRRDATYRRFYSWDGQVYRGFGGPGFYGGQYNGGSIGPCWTNTPIGFIYNCGG